MQMPCRLDGHPVILTTQNRMLRLYARLERLGRLPMWTVYRPPTREYGLCWVARMFVGLPQCKATRFVITHDSHAELLTLLPPGLVRIVRSPADPPEIVEAWI